jgi:diguanylate cyclase (GGDEF)-like protein/putative nucleotidyltransferase with HDIG domain
VASGEPQTYTDELISFIYHAASHFSTVFSALAQVRKLATRDPMTGLYNRYHLEQEYLAAAKVCKRYHHQMAVVIADIDHFKSVNDTYGHLVGDEVLREVSQVIHEVSRESDIVARYGGEEFVVLLPRGGRKEAFAYGERLREVVRHHMFCEGSYGLRLTVSIGIAYGNPTLQEGTDDFPLLSQADTAVYEAKKTGRNRIQVWQEHLLPKYSKALPSAEQFREIAERRKDARILVVDDEDAVREVYCEGLEREGYECVSAASGLEAVELVTSAPYAYDLLLADIKMAGMDGLELIKRCREINDTILSVAISGRATVEMAVESLRHGAYDFVEKPVRLDHLMATVRRALEYRTAVIENKRYQDHLSEMVEQKSARLNESLEEVRRSYEFTLESLIGLLDAREKDFGQHSKRVRNLSVFLARRMGLDEDQVETIGRGALLHDIGKIGVPDSILLKTGELTGEEWETMKQHTETGYRILAASPYLSGVAEIVRAHHERFDGKGYPLGLSKHDICLGARIFAAVDAYDAMRSDRVYQPALSAAAALAEIEDGSGTQFDPEVVEVFTSCHSQLEEIFLHFR